MKNPVEIIESTTPRTLASYGDVLNVGNVAEILQVSERTIYRLVEKDELPYRKIGRRLYFPKCEIAALLGL